MILWYCTYADNQSNPWVGLGGNTGVSGEDKSSDNDDGEDQKTDGHDVTDDGEGGERDVMALGAGLFDFLGIRHGCDLLFCGIDGNGMID